MFFPVPGDPYRSSVALHLPMTGANNSTTFTDVSPLPKTIMVYGNAKILTAQSKWGKGSAYFDGSGALLSVTNSGTLTFDAGAFTIELWIYTSSASQINLYPRILASGAYNSAGTWNLVLLKSTGELFFDHYTTPVGRSLGLLVDNTWTHLEISRDADSVMRGFQNGVQAFSVTDTKNLNGVSNIIVGAENTSGTSTWVGYLQDLRINIGVARHTANFDPPSGPLPYRPHELPVRTIIQPHQFHQIARLGL